MSIEQRLYSSNEVKQLIKDLIHRLAVEVAQLPEKSPAVIEKVLNEWGMGLLPTVEQLIAEEVSKRHVIGVTLAVWAGPPGSGKGTNIEAISILTQAYAEYASQGGARILVEPFHSKMLALSVSRGKINTGTKGMFNRPEGEYAELFGELQAITGEHVANGGFVPDAATSVLVELMVLLRLVQGQHKIQIDLWPRTKDQSKQYLSLVSQIRNKQGKIGQELINLRIMSSADISAATSQLTEYAQASRNIGKSLAKHLLDPAFVEKGKVIGQDFDPRERFLAEKALLHEVFQYLDATYVDAASQVLINELKRSCERIEYRFNLALNRNEVPRAGELPLSLIRRLAIFACDTSPAFLEIEAQYQNDMPIKVVSALGTPEEVVIRLLGVLVGVEVSTDDMWNKLLKFAGSIANDIVAGKSPVVDDVVVALGSILLA